MVLLAFHCRCVSVRVPLPAHTSIAMVDAFQKQNTDSGRPAHITRIIQEGTIVKRWNCTQQHKHSECRCCLVVLICPEAKLPPLVPGIRLSIQGAAVGKTSWPAPDAAIFCSGQPPHLTSFSFTAVSSTLLKFACSIYSGLGPP